MAVKTRAQIQTDLDTILINTAAEGSITPEVVKGIFEDINDSVLNPNTDTNQRGLYPYDATLVYYAGAIVQYDYKWYKANTTTVAGAFDPSDWDFQGFIRYSGSLSLNFAEILALNTTPQTLVAAIAGKAIQILNVSAKLTYGTATYATNTSLDIYQSVGGAPNISFTLPSFLANTADIHKVATITADASLEQNSAIKVRANTGDPTTGDSTAVIYFDYIVI